MRVLIALFVCIQVYFAYGDDCPTGLCPSDQTCCNGPIHGLYGCCPEPNAVCCSDGEHCCPQNTVCDLAKGTCDSSGSSSSLLKKPEIKVSNVILKSAEKAEIVYCPDGASSCPDGNTCCRLSIGMYGCCPYPSATCCTDGVHCCPYGSRCDATSQYCLQADTLFRVAPKRPTKSPKKNGSLW